MIIVISILYNRSLLTLLLEILSDIGFLMPTDSALARGPGSERSVPIKLSFSFRYSKKDWSRSKYFPILPMLLTEKNADFHTLLTCLDNIRCESTSTLRSWGAGVGDLR